MSRQGALALCLFAFACTPESQPQLPGALPPLQPRADADAAVAMPAQARPPRLELELSDAEASPAPRALAADLEPLRGSAAEEALAAVAPLAPADAPSPFVRGPRPPRLRPSAESFPPKASTAETAPEPFAATAWPQGEVADPSELRVSFTRKVAGVQPGASARRVPVTLRPDIPGDWRWLDERTLSFRPTLRFPKATEFSVELARTLRSADGEELDRRVRWSFSTPTPRVVATLPAQDDPSRLDWPRGAPVLVLFDQAVRPQESLGALRLEAAGRSLPLRLATREEVERFSLLRKAAADAPPSHWMAVRTVDPLPTRAQATLTVGPGVLSLEGARPSTETASLAFAAGAPFDQVSLECYWAPAPFLTVALGFDARLDPEAFGEDDFSTVPALAQRRVTLSRDGERSRVTITGIPEDAGPITIHHTVALAGEDGVHPVLPGELKCDRPPLVPQVVRGSNTQLAPDGRLALWLTAPQRLRARAWLVEPTKWTAHADRLAASTRPWFPEGDPAFDQTLELTPDHGRAWIDLSQAFGEHSDLIVALQRDGETAPPGLLWLQRAPVQLLARRVGGDVAVLALSASARTPIAGLRVEAASSAATTDAAGVALLRGVDPGASVVTAPNAAGQASVRISSPVSCHPTLANPQAALVPGTTATLAGYGCAGTANRASFELSAGSTRLTRGEVAIDAQGRFELPLSIPAGAPAGSATLRVALRSAGGERVDELSTELTVRRSAPSRVSLSLLPNARAVVQGASLLFRADVHDGERPLAGATLEWEVTARPARLEFPGLEGFFFGSDRAAWAELAPEIEALGQPDLCHGSPLPALRGARTGADGSHALRVKPRGGDALPLEVSATARLSGLVERHASTQATFFPGATLPGLRADRSFFAQGEVAQVDVIAADRSGQRAPGTKVLVRAIGERWSPHLGGWRARSVDVQQCEVTTERVAVQCRFRLAEKAVYRVIATARDASNRISQSELSLWVEGAAFPPRRELMNESLELFAERDPGGDGAIRLLLRTDAPGARALLLVGRDGGLHEARAVELKEPSVFVDLRPDARGAKVEALAFTPQGVITAPVLSLDAVGRPADRLSVQVETERLAPGRAKARIRVSDGRAAPAADLDVVLTAMDVALDTKEPVPAWDEWIFPSPAFLPEPPPQASESRASNSCPIGTAGSVRVQDAQAPSPLSAVDPALRTWRLTTDAAGRAEVELELPQPTRYLLRAQVVDPARGVIGEAEATVASGDPVESRLVAPRAARPGDLATVVLMLENHDGRPLGVTVAARASGGKLAGPSAMRVELPPGRPVEVPLSMEVGRAKEMALRVLVSAPGWQRQLEAAASIEDDLERAVVYGSFDAEALDLPVSVPKRAGEKQGALHLSLSPSPLSSLSDAVLALVERPSDETSLVAFRLIALASLGDGISALSAPGLPSAAGLAAMARADVDKLAARQLPDGTFREDEGAPASSPFVSVLAADALARAKQAGLAVPEPTLERARAMLAVVRSRLPSEPDARDAVEAYALRVRARLGERDPEAARALAARALEGHSAETLAWLAVPLEGDPLAGQLERWFEAHQLQDEAGTHHAAVYRSGAGQVLHSEHRAHAVVLEALLETSHSNQVVSPLARGLLSHRAAGRWSSSGENAFAIAALARLWRVENRSPVTAKAWLGGAFLGEQRFGAAPRVAQVSVPMSLLIARPRDYELVMAKLGPGRLHYRAELDWADDAEDRREGGFGIERTYLPIEPRGIERDLRAGWRAQSGARVRVRLQLFVPSCARGATLRDALPAGFEPVGELRVLEGRSCSGRAYAPELRRERAGVTAWLGELGPGLHTLEYTAVGVARGDWRAPPPRLADSGGQRAVGASDRIAVE